ncbi:MAG: DMT family transporter [Acidimicrobiales bacterium]
MRPEHIVLLKGLVAGGANVALGLSLGGRSGIDAATVAAALLVGAVGYGVSIVLWVKGARDLGAARGQIIFATAPFIGASIAWTVLDETVTAVQLVAVVLAAAGVALSIESAHGHAHRHEPIEHDHEHTHDDGHHEHHDGHPVARRHAHPHRHEPRVPCASARARSPPPPSPRCDARGLV